MFDLRTIIINKKSLIETDIRQYDVVMVTSTMYKHFYDKTTSNMIMYKRMIFDEPDSTHIPGFCKLNSLFSWYVTGTPRRLISMRSSRGHHICDWVKRYDLYEDIDKYVITNSVNLIKSANWHHPESLPTPVPLIMPEVVSHHCNHITTLTPSTTACVICK